MKNYRSYTSFIMLFFCIALFHNNPSAFPLQEGKGGEKSDEILLQEKISVCPFLSTVFSPGDKWTFSKEEGMLYANLIKGQKTFVFGYKEESKREWGEHLPRWYFAVGSMELGLVIASFNGIVKDGKFIVNNIAGISKKCPIRDIHASITFEGRIDQISIDENCDKFVDKVFTVNMEADPDYDGNEPWAKAVKIISEDLKRLHSGRW